MEREGFKCPTLKMDKIDLSKCFYQEPIEKLVKIAREQKTELRDARLAVIQLTKLVEYLEEEILEKDEIIQDLTKGRN